MSHFHAVVWIDHKESKIFHFDRESAEKLSVQAGDTSHLRHHANVTGSSHAKTSDTYLHEVAHAVADAGAILLTGPANAKQELMQHLQKHDPQIAEKVVGIETVDHPTDGQLVAHARKYFKSAELAVPRIQR